MDTSSNKKYLQQAEKLRITHDQEFIEPQVALKQKNLKSDGYTTTGTRGNQIVIIGKAKSRKSFYLGILASAALGNELILGTYKGELPKEQSAVAYFDTEQGAYHVQKAQKRICSLTKKEKLEKLYLYHLRALEPSERLKVIEAVIYANDNLGIVVIDGIRDLVTSINDEGQATMICSKLLKWSEERNILIIVVLHQNKGNDFARGHLGTELINKAELVLSVTKQKSNEAISIVKAEYSRDIEPEPFSFTIIDGLPVAVEDFVENTANTHRQKKLKDHTDEDKLRLLGDVFSDDTGLMYGELKNQIKSSYNGLFKENVGDNQAKDFITECKSKKWVDQEKPKGKYTLSSSLEPP
ncbi:AAA family ATPase [Aestuariivivens sediminis]|uniref:AAA family ATPase n=1 Tax=Aestuariivivens sediminis TaxID=2913557 RepID=UPI001F58C20B|nr:AAA family ATPase [Aestuariivivens sediminis]